MVSFFLIYLFVKISFFTSLSNTQSYITTVSSLPVSFLLVQPHDLSMDIHILFHFPLVSSQTSGFLHITLLLSSPQIQVFSSVLLLHTASRCIFLPYLCQMVSTLSTPTPMAMFHPFCYHTLHMILHCPYIPAAQALVTDTAEVLPGYSHNTASVLLHLQFPAHYLGCSGRFPDTGILLRSFLPSEVIK